MIGAAPPVLFSTNYDMAEARRLWSEGGYPGAHLFGTVQLAHDGRHVVDLPPMTGGKNRLTRTLASRFGGAAAQLAVLRHVGEAPVAFAADPTTYAALALARGVGLWRHPVIAIVHPEVRRDVIGRRVLRSYDVVIAHSRTIRDELLEMGHSPERTLWAPYGPDLSFPGYQPTGSEWVVSSGKTHRDEATLLAALANVDVDARVHTLAHKGTVQRGRVAHVGRARYPEVLADLRHASAVAIPLARTSGTYGVTEILDALGLGKPVVVTRSPHIDVDVDAVGCGITVAPGDVVGWTNALRELAEDPIAAAERGALGRRYAEEHWSQEHYAEVVRAALAMVGAAGG